MDEKACSNIEIKRSFYVPERGNTYVEVLYNEPQDIRTNLINAEVERVFSEDNTNMKLFASWDYKNYKGRVVEPNEFVLQLVKPKSYSFESKTMSEKSEYRLAPTGDDMLTWKMDKEGLPSSVSFSMYRNRILDKVPATLVGLLFGFVIHGLLRLSKDYLMKLSEKYGFSFSRDSFF